MKYSKEWDNYLDKLNACCRATHLTALHTKSCVVYVNAVVKDVEEMAKVMKKVVKGLNKEEKEIAKVGITIAKVLNAPRN